MVDAKIELSSITAKIDNLIEDIFNLEESDDEHSKELHEQELEIQETEFRIKSLEDNQNLNNNSVP